MTDYKKRVIIIVPDADKVAANAAALAFDSLGKEFDVPLSIDGFDPATHWGLNTVVTDDTLASIQDLQTTTFPLAKIYRGYSDYDTDPVLKYTWSEALNDAGLQGVNPIE